MISVLDDYCAHQAPGYISIPGVTDRNFYDRYFFNGYTLDATIMFGIAFGRYPNRMVKDAHFTVMIDGVQHSLHASDDDEMVGVKSAVGPMSIEIIEPMRRVRCQGADPGNGIAYDLMFEGRSGVINEGPLTDSKRGIVYHSATRFMQYGAWTGWIEVDGHRREIGEGEAFGLRDKSWGIRPIGEQLATHRKSDGVFWMNVVMCLPDTLCIIRTLQNGAGKASDHAGYFAPLYKQPEDAPIGEKALRFVEDWRFDLTFANADRQVTQGAYTLVWPDQAESRFTARALNTFWYSGMGYHHRKWNHGLSHGGLLVARESRPAAEIDRAEPEGMFMCSLLEISQDGQVVGFGHTEHLFVGSYAPFQWGEDDYVDLG